MGKPKHGKDSARTKSSAKYKAEGRRAINKAKKAAKIAAGKKIPSHRMKKTWLMKWDDLIRNTPKSKPYVDANGTVYWGIEEKGGKEKLQAMKAKKGKGKKSGNGTNSAPEQAVATA